MSSNGNGSAGRVGRKARPAPASTVLAGRDHVAEMLACVRASGLKLTPQRMAIVRELAADPTHPTAQELYERLRPGLPTMSFATVYNTLDALAAAGLCAALSLAPGPARFDPNMAAHHHAVCDRCGLVRDVPAAAQRGGSAPPPNKEAPTQHGGSACENDAGVGALSAVAPGFELRAVEHIYRGLCAECAGALWQGAPPGLRKRPATSPATG
jgi:Fe2+ or Zn2+ uptake regulation protein